MVWEGYLTSGTTLPSILERASIPKNEKMSTPVGEMLGIMDIGWLRLAKMGMKVGRWEGEKVKK